MPESREIHYECEGRQLVGRLAVPDGDGPFAGVLIAHEGPGHDQWQLARADRLAEEGYAAFALDYHGDLAPFADRDLMVARLDELRADPERLVRLGVAGLEQLLAVPSLDPTRVAAIGHCFGATLALEMGRQGLDLAAIVGFHPGLTTSRPEAASNIRGRVRMFVGADDPVIPLDDRLAFEDEMRAGGVDWEVHLYGKVGHSFTHPMVDRLGLPGLAYDEVADHHSWHSMLALLGETLAPEGAGV